MGIDLEFYDASGKCVDTVRMNAIRDYLFTELIVPFWHPDDRFGPAELSAYADAMDAWLATQIPPEFPLRYLVLREVSDDGAWLRLVRDCFKAFESRDAVAFGPLWKQIQCQVGPRTTFVGHRMTSDLDDYVAAKSAIIRAAAAAGWTARWSY